ncbi:MAG: hypothetical protein HY701_01200 [Gemmatimonadetes bacterium]|nr:hypothetical protein [Gemmatimonadota bacterium]
MSVNISPTRNNIVNLTEALPGVAGSGSLPFRFNWKAPFILSPHNSRTIYFGGNHLFKSTDRGDTWRIISPDLSTNNPVFTAPAPSGWMGERGGAERHASVITIAESPLVPGLIWVGTDDGNVQLTRDDGKTWTNVRPNVPEVPANRWVSRVEASSFAPGTAYVTFDGHRSDDFRPYVFKTTDYGRSWTSLAATLPPNAPVYAIKEDLKNPNLLFAGTETSLHASLDGGRTWHRFMSGFPTVPVHDLVIHPRDGDLVAGTHGRGIWIADDITPLQQLTPEVLASAVHLFENRVATKWHGINRGATRGHFMFTGRNPLTIQQREPLNNALDLENSATVTFFLREAPAGPVTIEISSLDGTQKVSTPFAAERGINRYFWNLRFTPPGGQETPGGPGGGGAGFAGGPQGRAGAEAAAGTYRVRLTVSGRTYEGILTVREDPEVKGIGG